MESNTEGTKKKKNKKNVVSGLEKRSKIKKKELIKNSYLESQLSHHQAARTRLVRLKRVLDALVAKHQLHHQRDVAIDPQEEDGSDLHHRSLYT